MQRRLESFRTSSQRNQDDVSIRVVLEHKKGQSKPVITADVTYAEDYYGTKWGIIPWKKRREVTTKLYYNNRRNQSSASNWSNNPYGYDNTVVPPHVLFLLDDAAVQCEMERQQLMEQHERSRRNEVAEVDASNDAAVTPNNPMGQIFNSPEPSPEPEPARYSSPEPSYSAPEPTRYSSPSPSYSSSDYSSSSSYSSCDSSSSSSSSGGGCD